MGADRLVLRSSVLAVFDSSNRSDWNPNEPVGNGPGAFGYTPAQGIPFYLGAFDLRPWEGPPKGINGAGLADWRRVFQAVHAGDGVLSCTCGAWNGAWGGSGFGWPAGLGEEGGLRHLALPLMAAAFDDAAVAAGQWAGAVPTFITAQWNQFRPIADLAPDLISSLRSEVPLSYCARGARFLALMTVGAWAGWNPTDEDIEVYFQVLGGVKPSQRWGEYGMPQVFFVDSVRGGPFSAPSYTRAICTLRPSTRTGLGRINILNGGAEPLDCAVEEFNGNALVTQSLFSINGATLGPPATAPVNGLQLVRGISHAVVYATCTNVAVAGGGPIMVWLSES